MLEPAEVVALAGRRGIGMLALTDHDTTSGLREALGAAPGAGVELIEGVEISCMEGKREVHILGLFIDRRAPELCALLEASRMEREASFRKVMERLEQLGAPVDPDMVLGHATGETVGRLHIARALVESGHVGSTKEAFVRFLGEGRPARVHRERPSVAHACAAIRRAGGVSSLAHPGGDPGLVSQEAVLRMRDDGLDAIEARHPAHDERTVTRIERWASSMGLLVSGGSDFHGPGEGSEIGACFIGEEPLDRLRSLAESR